MGSNVENAIATPIFEAAKHEIGGFVGGTSPAMLTLEAVLSEIAPTNIPVLLVGECGTGKQMFAHRIHQLSDRSEPLIKVSCAGMRAESFASELGLDTAEEREYGHDAGTAFFDEISELDAGVPKESAVRVAGRRSETATRNFDGAVDLRYEPESR